MLSHIYRLIKNFEHEHGIHPNLLYLNRRHVEYLVSSFGDEYSLEHIMAMLEMELIIEEDNMHPNVVWTTLAQARIAC
jgi:hypothetical protein